ncbi:MAG: MGMT family protein, partial [Dehalococcoidales bacterium]|nr:MGMT family protein [Dehalococcoidales bacterium]
TWRQKMVATAEKQGLPRVVEVTGKMSRRWGEGTCVIPSPVEVDGVMGAVPAGRLITINQIRAYMADKYHASFGCPITTGIFVVMAARAADEAAKEGRADIPPYWRVLRSNGELNEKYPGGLEAQATRLQAEGHEIERDKAGKPKRVKGWEAKLVSLGDLP